MSVKISSDTQVNSQQSKVLAGIIYTIGSVVYKLEPNSDDATKKERRPVAGATVALEDHGRITGSDAQGRFIFSNIAPGKYTLLVTTKDGLVGRQEIQVPPGYDVEVKPPL